MHTKELEGIIRDRLLEYQSDPIDSTYILRCLNEAYRFAYNHFVKSNDTLFGEVYELPIYSGQTEYDLPENLWTKRIEHFQIPSPPNESQQPWGWVKIPRVDWKQSYRYQTNRIRTYYPNVWSQMNNKIYVYPPALVNFTAKMVISRRLTPLGTYGGRITNLQSNIITLDELNDSRIASYASDSSMAFISITDHTTGELKALYPYSTVDTTNKKITLTTAPYGRKYAAYVIQDLTWVATTSGTDGQDISVQYINSGSSGLAVSVSDKLITVNFGGATPTATQVRAAAIAVAAVTALASPVITGTGSTVQVVASEVHLVGGANHFMEYDISDLPGTEWGSVELDDYVTFGVATAVSIFGEAFDTFLTDWATMKIRGALNETDPEVVNSLKLQLQELTGDLGGRVTGQRINRSVMNQWGTRPFRR